MARLLLFLHTKHKIMAHLCSEQRCLIETLKRRGLSNREIACEVNVHPTTIAREISRNSMMGMYKYSKAQKFAEKRHKIKPKRKYLTDDMKAFIVSHLHLHHSPEQICGLARERFGFKEFVSTQTIYNYIYEDRKNGGTLFKYLPRHKKKYRKKTPKQILNENSHKVNISERPPEASDRQRFGDLELDTVVGKDRKTCILTINDRATGFLFAVPAQMNSDSIKEQITNLLNPIKDEIFTLTSDNGKEFTKFVQISNDLDVNFYHCNPHQPWQRGSNENLNGLIRRVYPKQYDFRELDHNEFNNTVKMINARPRKRYNYYSPVELLLNK
jgi:IS30 family transposase